MIYKNTLRTLTILLFFGTILMSKQISACEPPVIYPSVYYPISESYFLSFMASEVEFSNIAIIYSMGIAPGYPDKRDQYLFIQSNTKTDGDNNWINMYFNEIEHYIADYKDSDIPQFYHSGHSTDELIPFFSLISADIDYFCSGSEYGENEYLEFVQPYQVLGLDYKNYIMFAVYPPDKPPFALSPVKAFIKGWHPSDDPPEELLPLIDFFEAEIIPIAREHPY